MGAAPFPFQVVDIHRAMKHRPDLYPAEAELAEKGVHLHL